MMISLLAAMAVSGALAGEHDPDGVIATAARDNLPLATSSALADIPSPATTSQDVTPHGLTTDEQISRWIGTRTAETSQLVGDPWERTEERRMRGEVSVGVGTGGYRDYAATVSVPLGENAQVTMSFSQTRNAPYLYGPYSPYGAYGPLGYSGYGGSYWDEPYRGRRLSDPSSRPLAPAAVDPVEN